jgi:hypothetical protein
MSLFVARSASHSLWEVIEGFPVLFVEKKITIETTGTGNIEHEYFLYIYYEYN